MVTVFGPSSSWPFREMRKFFNLLSQEQRLELIQRFREENGTMDCAALLEAAYARGEEKKPHCDRLVRQCLEFVCRETGLE